MKTFLCVLSVATLILTGCKDRVAEARITELEEKIEVLETNQAKLLQRVEASEVWCFKNQTNAVELEYQLKLMKIDHPLRVNPPAVVETFHPPPPAPPAPIERYRSSAAK